MWQLFQGAQSRIRMMADAGTFTRGLSDLAEANPLEFPDRGQSKSGKERDQDCMRRSP